MGKIFLSVVIPSYDEMANLQKGVLDKVSLFLFSKKYTYEVIIVDDGSKDGSVEFTEQFIKKNSSFRLIKNHHLGKAGAVTTGVLRAEGKFILFTDMDQATPIEELDKLMPFFNRGFDIVIGSRSSRRKNAPWTRLIMARGMILLRSLVIGMKDISDTQCGFKIFEKNPAKILFRKISTLHNNFKPVSGSSVSAGFDIELLYLAKRMGYKIKEVPVDWLYVESRRVNPVRDSINGVLDLLKIKFNDTKGLYS